MNEFVNIGMNEQMIGYGIDWINWTVNGQLNQ